MIRGAKILVAATIALGVPVLAPAAWASAAPAVAMSPAAEASASSVASASWVPWDGNHITTAANCSSRRQQLIRDYRIRTSAIKCQQFTIGTCPPTYYYMVMIDENAQPARRLLEEQVAYAASTQRTAA